MSVSKIDCWTWPIGSKARYKQDRISEDHPLEPDKPETVERLLRIAVFQEAVDTYKKAVTCIAVGKHVEESIAERDDVLSWMNEGEPLPDEVVLDDQGNFHCYYKDWPMRFEAVCDDLGMDPDRIRRWTREYQPTEGEKKARLANTRPPV